MREHLVCSSMATLKFFVFIRFLLCLVYDSIFVFLYRKRKDNDNVVVPVVFAAVVERADDHAGPQNQGRAHQREKQVGGVGN